MQQEQNNTPEMLANFWRRCHGEQHAGPIKVIRDGNREELQAKGEELSGKGEAEIDLPSKQQISVKHRVSQAFGRARSSNSYVVVEGTRLINPKSPGAEHIHTWITMGSPITAVIISDGLFRGTS